MEKKKIGNKSVSGLFELEARWRAEVYRVDGDYEDSGWMDNLVVTAGKEWLAGFMSTSPASAMNFVAVGTGTTAASLNQTVLVNEVARKAMATRTAAGNVLTSVVTFGGAADGVTSAALTEAGVFNDVNSGQVTMFQRIQSTLATLADSDFLKLTIETSVGSA